MFNYYTDIIWTINAVLLAIAVLTSLVIFFTAFFKDLLWEKRRKALLNVKKDVYELVISGQGASKGICYPVVADITPQQFIDIETNRRIDIAFFNESEQQFFKKCFITPERIASLEKIAKNSRNKWKKIEAILSLGYIKASEALGILEEALLSRDKDIAYFAIISLGQIKTIEAARMLLKVLIKDPANSYKIVSILQDYPKEILDDVVKLIDYHDPMVRYWIAVLLSKFAPAQYINNIEKLVHDSSPDVRAAACKCLGNIGSSEAKEALITCLKDDSWQVRREAVLGLSKIMKGAVIPHVIGFINDASWSVVDAVKEAMTDNIDASLPYIEKFLTSDDEIPKKYSIYALQDSGYLDKLLGELLSGDPGSRTINLLKGIVRSKTHYGLDAAIARLDPARQDKALEMLIEIQKD
ncbi:MAG: HEAT repeat domain-containing protein [Candidatus Omnitrophota bacterium]|jgi:hypothetical protein